MKEAFKKFKHSTSLGFKILKEIEQQNLTLDSLKKAIQKSYDYSSSNVSTIKRKFAERVEPNR